MSDPNINNPVYDEPRDHPGFVAKSARLGRQVKSERVGLSLWEIAAGEAAYPYHWHTAEEEVLVVLEGQPSLRTPDGWRELDEGAVIRFALGEGGAHQLVNRTQHRVRFLGLSNQAPEVVVYPDSGKVGCYERRPDGSGIRLIFRECDAVDYHEGEAAP